MARQCKYSEADLAQAVAVSISYRNVLKLLGIKQAGGSQSHIKRRIERSGLDVSHFKGQAHSRGKKLGPRRSAAEILTHRPAERGREKSEALHRALREIGRAYECEKCSNPGEWLGEPLTLQVDHSDGDWTNNEADNLRYICPNCYQQTPNFGSKNMRV